MAEQIQHGGKGGGAKSSIWSLMSDIVWSRFFLYMYDYICMKLPGSRRYKQLSQEHLVCRFCGNATELVTV